MKPFIFVLQDKILLHKQAHKFGHPIDFDEKESKERQKWVVKTIAICRGVARDPRATNEHIQHI